MSTPRIPYLRPSSVRRMPVPGPDPYHLRVPLVPAGPARRLRAQVRHERVSARIRARTLTVATVACYAAGLGFAASAWFALTPVALVAAWYLGVRTAEVRARARLFDADAPRPLPSR